MISFNGNGLGTGHISNLEVNSYQCRKGGKGTCGFIPFSTDNPINNDLQSIVKNMINLIDNNKTQFKNGLSSPGFNQLPDGSIHPNLAQAVQQAEQDGRHAQFKNGLSSPGFSQLPDGSIHPNLAQAVQQAEQDGRHAQFKNGLSSPGFSQLPDGSIHPNLAQAVQQAEQDGRHAQFKNGLSSPGFNQLPDGSIHPNLAQAVQQAEQDGRHAQFKNGLSSPEFNQLPDEIDPVTLKTVEALDQELRQLALLAAFLPDGAELDRVLARIETLKQQLNDLIEQRKVL